MDAVRVRRARAPGRTGKERATNRASAFRAFRRIVLAKRDRFKVSPGRPPTQAAMQGQDLNLGTGRTQNADIRESAASASPSPRLSPRHSLRRRTDTGRGHVEWLSLDARRGSARAHLLRRRDLSPAVLPKPLREGDDRASEESQDRPEARGLALALLRPEETRNCATPTTTRQHDDATDAERS